MNQTQYEIMFHNEIFLIKAGNKGKFSVYDLLKFSAGKHTKTAEEQ